MKLKHYWKKDNLFVVYISSDFFSYPFHESKISCETISETFGNEVFSFYRKRNLGYSEESGTK